MADAEEFLRKVLGIETKEGGGDSASSTQQSGSGAARTEVISKALLTYLDVVNVECEQLRQQNQDTRQTALNGLLAAMAALISGLGRFTVQETVQGLKGAAELFDPLYKSGKSPAGGASAKRKGNWVD